MMIADPHRMKANIWCDLNAFEQIASDQASIRAISSSLMVAWPGVEVSVFMVSARVVS